MSQLPILSDPVAAPVTRRDFVCTTTASLLAAALAAACGGGGGDGGPTSPATSPPPQLPPNAGATFVGNVLTVQLAQFAGLAQRGGFQVFGSIGGQPVDVIVIHVGDDVYRAFTSICTHEGCTVAYFTGARIQCPCHGSEYDTSGRNVAGPAPRPLAEYRASYDAGTRTVTVAKG